MRGSETVGGGLGMRKLASAALKAQDTPDFMSMCDRAYHFIKQRIVTNETSVGDQINDREIAEQLGISRTPVREACLLLQKEGFVEIVPRLGVRVRPLFLEDIRELYDILIALETMAVGLLAARHLTLDELGPLREAVQGMRAGLKGDDFSAWIEADERFHRALFELSGNRRLAEAGMSYRDQVQRAHVVALKLRERPTKFVEGHAELVELIRRGEVQAARERHHTEWVRAREELMAAVTRYGLKCL
jgi:DNA-binding GntR family transcriptional regulator